MGADSSAAWQVAKTFRESEQGRCDACIAELVARAITRWAVVHGLLETGSGWIQPC